MFIGVRGAWQLPTQSRHDLDLSFQLRLDQRRLIGNSALGQKVQRCSMASTRILATPLVRPRRVPPRTNLEAQVTNDFYCDEALSGKTPVEVVVETAGVLAFHHTRPHWAVHIVVVPKVHIPSLTDLGGHSMEVVHRLLEVVRQVAAQVEREHGACRVITNLGAYQDSKHLHFHVGAGELRKDQRAPTADLGR